MPEQHELDTMFYPRSVAVVGASANPASWGGTNFLSRLQKLGFSGELYPVNPRDTEILGLKAYPSVKSIPNPPELVIIAIPASVVPQVLKDCVATGVRNVHIFSSGFAETGLEEGRRLDEEITEIIQQGGLRVVGPNCMGLYIPKSKLAYWGAEPTGSGPVAFLSQSGGHAEWLSEYAQDLGVYFSKIVSFGNARGLQAVDFLEYLAQDPETSIITMYLEGIREGNRFAQLIKSINRTKPVIIWKGGLTESGSRAVASHTGSLAGEERVWDAFFTQTGAVRVDSLQEIVDVVMAFLYLQPPRGRRTLLIGGGGGNSVAMADICSQEGLEVPRLAEETRQKLNTFISLAGNSARNPVDAWMLQNNVELFQRALELAAGDPVIDLVILDQYTSDTDDYESPENGQKAEKVGDFIIDFAKNNRFGKPVVLALNGRFNAPDSATSIARLWRKFALAGVPTYISQQSASRALSRFIGYHQFQQRHADVA
ncbi:MAG TPA: hypothetical protein G4O10_02575 [Dehalococcoidia bacterium]|nr:hypothetical protein [Dehalococcoidia bacterium]